MFYGEVCDGVAGEVAMDLGERAESPVAWRNVAYVDTWGVVALGNPCPHHPLPTGGERGREGGGGGGGREGGREGRRKGEGERESIK